MSDDVCSSVGRRAVPGGGVGGYGAEEGHLDPAEAAVVAIVAGFGGRAVASQAFCTAARFALWTGVQYCYFAGVDGSELLWCWFKCCLAHGACCFKCFLAWSCLVLAVNFIASSFSRAKYALCWLDS